MTQDLPQSSDEAARELEHMTEDELFTTLMALEEESEVVEPAGREDVLYVIALVQSEVERRYPGQLLAPVRDWKKNQLLI